MFQLFRVVYLSALLGFGACWLFGFSYQNVRMCFLSSAITLQSQCVLCQQQKYLTAVNGCTRNVSVTNFKPLQIVRIYIVYINDSVIVIDTRPNRVIIIMDPLLALEQLMGLRRIMSYISASISSHTQ